MGTVIRHVEAEYVIIGLGHLGQVLAGVTSAISSDVNCHGVDIFWARAEG